MKNKSDAYYKQIWREPSLLSCSNLRELAEEFLNALDLNYSDVKPLTHHCFCENMNQKKYGIEVIQVKKSTSYWVL